MHFYLYILALIAELILLLCITLYALGVLYSSLMGAPFVPTSKKRIEDILKHAGLKKGQVFLELGSGDGRIVRRAVAEYGVQGIGVDINGLLVIVARVIARLSGLKGVRFEEQNILKTDLGQADVVYMFLMPALIRKMETKLKTEPKKGALLISHGFRLPGWEGKQIDELKTEPFSTFFYRA